MTAEAAGPSGIEVISDLHAFIRHSAEWDALVNATEGASCFMMSTWLACWWEAHQPTDVRVFLARDSRGGLVGGLALCAPASSGMPWRFLGAGTGDSYGLGLAVRASDMTGVVAALARSLVDGYGCRFVELNPCYQGARGTLELGHALEQRGWRSSMTEFPRLVARLPPTWAEYLAVLSSKKRSNLLYETRRLRRDHDVSFRRIGAGDSLENDIDSLFDLHQRRWGDNNENSFEDSVRQEFYRNVIRGFAARGELDLWFMDLDGRPTATHFGLRCGRTHHYLAGGFDPQFASLSVGNVMLGQVVRDLVGEGVEELDFLIGDERYKKLWGAASEHYLRLRLARPWTVPSARLAAEALRSPLTSIYHRVLPSAVRRRVRSLVRRAEVPGPIEDQ